ncbi:FHA domain-containing protein [Pseudoalteromonas luteoviolacea]|uniref:FHA domain-containing protein n=1 Tax=Pseudoalteromonas luteoviolacea S4054 TaxID=1129367 RepID=A0A0F6A9I0_9GAMM|nr:FHA domain-containing protein [Pseudoalteromonas luteoviolacea]AOT10697.1 hypothetical protein S4054249_22845 [Pseudoalteromonas luteoviolacea]AOT16141.1 hypothetical protein S40542_25665 [Pseudoalteromonas luteoviolacea]AOT20517.1 hypothetical protein S4054_22760 [Pseudoalteromonas luteoviolacea]KKE82069.1 hypothetical protein N479_20170 [Pseudoalteromonas luteoviolacea S4054]KZN67712.1 hypothetical protein N481_23745 [Pseudoalteromonas luteoviolacea S4047-1]
MAYLTSTNMKNRLYLKAFHRFGRLEDSVDTFINSPEISRRHAIIEWTGKAWMIVDISKNGMWLNGNKITPNEPYYPKVNDIISFSDQSNLAFQIDNLDKPHDILTPVSIDKKECHRTKDPIVLNHHNLLPSETSPELILYYDVKEKSWYVEDLEKNHTSKVSDDNLLFFSNTKWKLLNCANSPEKETIVMTEKASKDLTFIFNISQDEELTELTLENDYDQIDLDTRSHHYLTALLARYRTQDEKTCVPERLQGWRTIKQLTKDLGISESHINIQIHRARSNYQINFNYLGNIPRYLLSARKEKFDFQDLISKSTRATN